MYAIKTRVSCPFGKIEVTLSYSFLAVSSWSTRWVRRQSVQECTTNAYDTSLYPSLAKGKQDMPKNNVLCMAIAVPELNGTFLLNPAMTALIITVSISTSMAFYVYLEVNKNLLGLYFTFSRFIFNFL